MGVVIPNPPCNEAGKCFAKEKGKCTILIRNYQPGKCPFKMEKKNGRRKN